MTGISEAGLSGQEKALLAKNLFFMRPSGYDRIYDVYYNPIKGIIPFITADTMLHSFHVLFDFILRTIENDTFAPSLAELTRSMLEASVFDLNFSVSTLQGPCMRNIAFFKVALMLLGEDADVPEKARKMANDEFALIDSHSGSDTSPIFGYEEDYTQYVPRGHYTRNETLQRYFKAMMWYGRMAFRINTKDVEYNKSQALSSLLILAVLKDHTYDQWNKIYDTIAFFIGESDDLTIVDLNATALDIYGDDVKLTDLADDSKLVSFIDKAVKLKAPLIASSSIMNEDEAAGLIGMRFIGQGFTPDGYVFEMLVENNVPGRNMPMGLDIMAAFGSNRAFEILGSTYHETSYPGYTIQLNRLKAMFAGLGEDEWTGSLYRSWIYSLLPLLDEDRDGYPTFMKSRAWADKGLDTALGSWTELRHDTILYAKQNHRTAGSHSGPILPDGYVEPEPEFYGRLWSTVKMACDGLSSRGLLSDKFKDNMTLLTDLLASLRGISEKELTGQSLTEDENLIISWKVGNVLLNLSSFYSGNNSEGYITDDDNNMSIVSDVFTNTYYEQALEECVGRPYRIFVIVNANGVSMLATGAVFSYYEFKQPMGDRLTDEQWQDMLKNGQTPGAPEWTKDFKA